jgi:cyclopropane-fatty-acyl-phospholipid synthase
LDSKYRFYSAAEFDRPNETLEDAQERKTQRLLSMIDPQPGERILDAGSGWGGMMDQVNRATGGRADVVGYTLSREQQRYTQERFGLAVDLKDFVTTDFEEGSFDTIYSIETFEHVRRRELPAFARRLRRALKPNGKLVFQISCLPHTDEMPPPTALFLGLDTFPGTEGSSLPRLTTDFESAGFRVRHLQLLDYRPTLRAWFENLAAHQDEAVGMVGVQNYMRYLCFLAASWRLSNAGDVLNARILAQPS